MYQIISYYIAVAVPVWNFFIFFLFLALRRLPLLVLLAIVVTAAIGGVQSSTALIGSSLSCQSIKSMTRLSIKRATRTKLKRAAHIPTTVCIIHAAHPELSYLMISMRCTSTYVVVYSVNCTHLLGAVTIGIL